MDSEVLCSEVLAFRTPSSKNFNNSHPTEILMGAPTCVRGVWWKPPFTLSPSRVDQATHVARLSVAVVLMSVSPWREFVILSCSRELSLLYLNARGRGELGGDSRAASDRGARRDVTLARELAAMPYNLKGVSASRRQRSGIPVPRTALPQVARKSTEHRARGSPRHKRLLWRALFQKVLLRRAEQRLPSDR